MAINIFLPGDPIRTTHQMKQVNWKSRTFYEPPEVKAARQQLTVQLAKKKPEQPIEGPVAVDVCWHFTTKDMQLDGLPKTTRPDVDNLSKLLLDVMTQLGYWKDDAQIVRLSLEKYWTYGPSGGTMIRIKKMGREAE